MLSAAYREITAATGFWVATSQEVNTWLPTNIDDVVIYCQMEYNLVIASEIVFDLYRIVKKYSIVTNIS